LNPSATLTVIIQRSPMNSPIGPAARTALTAISAATVSAANAYAQEELVAELGAAFLCADLELAA